MSKHSDIPRSGSGGWVRALGVLSLLTALVGCYEKESCELGFSINSSELIGIHDWVDESCEFSGYDGTLIISDDEGREWRLTPSSDFQKGSQFVATTYTEGEDSWSRTCDLNLTTLEDEEWTTGIRTRIQGTMTCAPLYWSGGASISPLTLERFELSAFIEEFAI
ncbi:hypothetical protein [Plesiocystis pacifica]|uniref:hypothetical protein n=1 Tax=Plesiocystis pacifica TaxID=191768 RepID=UPI0012FA5C3F|nr:hypothetical protein [Plesiocystis pacifica]